MVGLTRFVITQLLFFLIAVGICGYTINSGLQQYASNHQLQIQRAIDFELKNISPISSEQLSDYAKALKSRYQLDRLIIKDTDNNTLFNDGGNLAYLPFLAHQVQNIEPYIRPQFAASEDESMRVEFTVRIAQATQNAQDNFIIAFTLFLVLSLVPFVVLKATLVQAHNRIGDAMSDMVDKYIAADKTDSQLDTGSLQGGLSNLFPIIMRLNTFLKRKNKEIEEKAQDIKREAYKDTVTGLGNRNLFIEHYGELVENEEKSSFGMLAVVRCSELNLINQTRGYQMGDQYITEVANIILKVNGTYSGSQCYRLNSSDFAVILPNIPAKEAEKFGAMLQAKFTEYQQHVELSSVANTGLVSYESGKPLGEILAQVDTAISLAQSKQNNAWHIQKETDLIDNVSASFGNQNWRQVIEDVLTNNRIQLLLQPIMPTSRNAKAYSEILTRFKTDDGHLLPTASFLAMSEKLDKVTYVDRMVIEGALDAIKTKNLSGQFFGINVTARSAHDEQFVIWLERRLLKDSTIAAKLIFEVSEFGLQQNVKASKRFIDMVHRVGSRITVERFGVGLTSFKFFRDLKPDFIKMDSSYTRGLEEDKNNQYFIRLMVDLAHRIGVTVLAEGVETQEEKHIVEQLCLDGAQGYYIERPTEI